LYVRRQEYEKALEYAIEAARINNKMHQVDRNISDLFSAVIHP
jgi:hypothetical protein